MFLGGCHTAAGACESPVPAERSYLVSLGLLESLGGGVPQDDRRREEELSIKESGKQPIDLRVTKHVDVSSERAAVQVECM